MSETAARHKAEAPKSLNFAVLICSTSRYAKLKSSGMVDDPSGDLIVQALHRRGHKVILRTLIPDDKHLIEESVKEALASGKVDVIITCGGTGISLTDVTIETVQPLLEKELQGFGELLRKISYDQIGSPAVLTRAIAGVSKGKAVFCVPGSPQAVSLALETLILAEAPHIIKHVREK